MPTVPTQQIKVSLPGALEVLRNGDILLFRPTTREGKWIYRFSRGPYSHVASAVLMRQKGGGWSWWCCEQIQPEARLVPLEPYLRSCPSGCVDVFRPNGRGLWKEYDPGGAVDWMLNHVGTPYGWGGMWNFLLSFAAFTRWRVRPSNDDQADGDQMLVCSAYRIRADRLGGKVDAFPNLADTWVTPSEIATNPFYQYRITVTHSGQEDSHESDQAAGLGVLVDAGRGGGDVRGHVLPHVPRRRGVHGPGRPVDR